MFSKLSSYLQRGCPFLPVRMRPQIIVFLTLIITQMANIINIAIHYLIEQ